MTLTRRFVSILAVLTMLTGFTLIAIPAGAVTDCTFTVSGTTMTLDADCTTDATIVIPDGFTLNGAGHSITAVDPVAGTFTGAVVASGGTTAFVTQLTVTSFDLANACKGGADRLRGIMFDGASGSITHSTVTGINKGASGCQEGNAIEIRNAPFDGTHPGTITVELAHNTISDWQKTGIVANGDVDVSIHHNWVGESATQENLAANGIQLGFGALGSVILNHVEGNQWMGTSDWGATAILVYAADVVEVSKNTVTGNSDIGLYVESSDGGVYEKNNLRDEGVDHPNSGDDIGIGDYGTNNEFNKNKVRGFDTPFDPDPLTGAKNKAFPAGS